MIVAVGSHSRKVGKTSITCALIRATPEIPWIAVKISANRRGIAVGLAIDEELEAQPDRDTGRFLQAGAKRSIWIRASDAHMEEAAAAVRDLAKHGHLIVESNRIVEHLDTDLFAIALDSRVSDFKESARRVFHRADVYTVSRAAPTSPEWPELPLTEMAAKPMYRIDPPDYCSKDLLIELRRRLNCLHREAAA